MKIDLSSLTIITDNSDTLTEFEGTAIMAKPLEVLLEEEVFLKMRILVTEHDQRKNQIRFVSIGSPFIEEHEQ